MIWIYSTPRQTLMSALMIMSLCLNAMPLKAQQRGASAVRPTTPVTKQPQTGTATQKIPTVAKSQNGKISLNSDGADKATATPYDAGQLPEPAEVPLGDIDETAEELAKQVAAKDENTVSALLTAMRIAGFSVRSPDGSIQIEAFKPGQGLVIPAGRVAAISKLYGDGLTVRFADLSAAFTEKLPAFKDVPFSRMIIAGISENAEGDNPATRFWARFIVGLGRKSARPYDLLDKNLKPETVDLDAVQMLLILTRLGGDLIVLDQPDADHKVSKVSKESAQPPRFISAAYTPTDSDSFEADRASATFAAPQAGNLPCTIDDTAGTIMDTAAAGSNFGFGQLMNYLSGKGLGGAGKLGTAAGNANIVLSLVKFLATYAALKIDIQMDAKELVRTKNTSPGAKQTLTAHARMNIGEWQMANCVRPVLNAGGLDFNLPNDGDVGDAEVEWKLEEGGDCRGWIGTVQDFGNIIGGGAPAGDGSIVFFDAAPGADRSPAKQTTDQGGLSRINLVGAPQKKDLSNKKLKEVQKKAKVKALITLSRIKDKSSLYSALLAAGGISASALTGDLKGAGIGLAFEMLNRSNSFFSATYTAPVKDWEECDDYELEFDSSFNNGFPGGEFFYHVHSKVKFNPCDSAGKIAPLEYVQYRASGNPGEAVFGKVENNVHGISQTLVSGTVSALGTKPDTLAVLELIPDSSQTPENDCKAQEEKQNKQTSETFSVIIDVGKPEEITQITSAATGASDKEISNDWADKWSHFHGREVYDPDQDAREALERQLMLNSKNLQKTKELLAKPENQKLVDEMRADEKASPTYQIKLKPVSPDVWRAEYNVPDNGILAGYTLSENSSITLRKMPKQ